MMACQNVSDFIVLWETFYQSHCSENLLLKIWTSMWFSLPFLLLWPNVEKCNNCNLQKPTTRGGFGRNAYWLQLEQAMKMHCNETLYLLLHPEKRVTHRSLSCIILCILFVCKKSKWIWARFKYLNHHPL